MLKQIKFWTVLLVFLMPACSGVKKDMAVITAIDLGATNTKLDVEGGIVDEYDLRLSLQLPREPLLQLKEMTKQLLTRKTLSME